MSTRLWSELPDDVAIGVDSVSQFFGVPRRLSLSDLTRDAVLAAIAEHDRLGRDAFLLRYGFGSARDYVLIANGREYDSKAIAGAAHGYVGPGSRPLPHSAFSGGRKTVARTLGRLGFVVRNVSVQQPSLPDLTVGQVYSWDELGRAFGFDAKLFQVGGGVLSRPVHNALLLITHPGGARSFDYEDRWDGAALIHTGRGKTGDQRLEGPNRDVAENRKQLFVLEAAGSKRLKYLGRAACTGHWIARASDSSGAERDVLKFRLSFEGDTQPSIREQPTVPNRRESPLRTSRPFSPDRVPSARPTEVNRRTTPEETAALQEKANQQHHRILSRLSSVLAPMGWQDIEEIPAAIDLWAKTPDRDGPVIFEVKGLSGSNQIGQTIVAVLDALAWRAARNNRGWKTLARAMVLTYRGVRPSHMMRIDPATHVFLSDEQPKVFIPAGKGGKAHWKPLTHGGVAAFRLFIISGAKGECSTSAFYKSWMLAADESGVEKFNPYKLRHPYATLLRRGGADVADVQELLGHKSAKTTQRYAAVIPEKLATAAITFQRMWRPSPANAPANVSSPRPSPRIVKDSAGS